MCIRDRYGFDLYTYKETQKQDGTFEKEGVYLKRMYFDKTNYPIIKLDEQDIYILSLIHILLAEQSSFREREAIDIEREVTDMKMAEYMSYHIGEEFEGMISSVTQFGFFVELPNTIDGLVHMTELTDDYYHYDEKNLMLVGEMTGCLLYTSRCV